MHKTTRFVIFIVVLLLLIGSLFLVKDLTTNASFAANFADNVLRPIFGNTFTIKIEAILFNAQDKIKQLGTPPDSRIVEQKLTWKPALIDKTDPTHPIFEISTYHPDPDRPYAVVHLVRINSQKTNINSVAGKKEPAAEVGNPGPGVVPANIQQSNLLIAAFNGGFQYRDGQYGMVADHTVYLPLKESLATFLVSKENQLSIEEYQKNFLIDKYIFARQNGEILLKNGLVIPSSQDKLAKVWGRSITSSMYTWRSGIGVDAAGNLIYAAGNSLIPETLGQSLKAAGALNGMQLDINPFWVRFSIFKSQNSGHYSHQSLFPKMYDGGKEYLTGYQKDFFYLTLDSKINPQNLEYKNLVNGWLQP